MANFNQVFQKKKDVKQKEIPHMKPVNIHYTKLLTSRFQYRNIENESIRKLADLIQMDGELLQPLLVRKSGADTYEILAGHKRHAACEYLVEQLHEERFAMIPCYVKTMSDAQAEFAVYSTNGYDRKTPYEQMLEIERMKQLMEEHPEAFPENGRGRVVERLARQMNISRSVISDYQSISHNLGQAGKKAFKEGILDKSAAVSLAGLPKTQQEELLKNGITTRKQIRSHIGNMKKTGQKGASIMADYEIDMCGDQAIRDVHHIRINYGENCYSVIYGKYINGGFFSIPNCGVGGELAAFTDIFWNTESISRVLKGPKAAAEQIAKAIADFARCKG